MSKIFIAANVVIIGSFCLTMGWFAGYSWGRKYMEKYIRLGERHLKPRTNADRIRAMSDKELAELLALACPTECRCDAVPYEDETTEQHCARCLLPWLKSTAKGEE